MKNINKVKNKNKYSKKNKNKYSKKQCGGKAPVNYIANRDFLSNNKSFMAIEYMQYYKQFIECILGLTTRAGDISYDLYLIIESIPRDRSPIKIKITRYIKEILEHIRLIYNNISSLKISLMIPITEQHKTYFIKTLQHINDLSIDFMRNYEMFDKFIKNIKRYHKYFEYTEKDKPEEFSTIPFILLDKIHITVIKFVKDIIDYNNLLNVEYIQLHFDKIVKDFINNKPVSEDETFSLPYDAYNSIVLTDFLQQLL